MSYISFNTVVSHVPYRLTTMGQVCPANIKDPNLPAVKFHSSSYSTTERSSLVSTLVKEQHRFFLTYKMHIQHPEVFILLFPLVTGSSPVIPTSDDKNIQPSSSLTVENPTKATTSTTETPPMNITLHYRDGAVRIHRGNTPTHGEQQVTQVDKAITSLEKRKGGFKFKGGGGGGGTGSSAAPDQLLRNAGMALAWLGAGVGIVLPEALLV